MKTLETIRLRLAGDTPETLADDVRRVVGSAPGPMEVRVYRHARIETDLVVHLHRENASGCDRASELGIRLASLLREYGMVDHTIWVDETDAGDR